ncbi:MAG: hypothetical protein ACREIA_13830 [Opitutaceae bacterium]
MLLLISPAHAQPAPEQPASAAQQQSSREGGDPNGEQMAEMSPMDTMAQTVTRVAEMCEAMMKGEMALKMGAAIAFGALLIPIRVHDETNR